jgi:hypothetical protein
MRQALAMARPAVAVPADLRARLEAARLHLDLKLMLRDTLASLEQLPELSARFRRNLPRRAHLLLAQLELTVKVCSPRKPTTWSRAVIPKTVKHPPPRRRQRRKSGHVQ